MTLTLTDFLLARIAEDQAVALAAALAGPPVHVGEPYDAGYVFVDRNAPTRIIAECEAKRRIVTLHGDSDPSGCTPWGRRYGEPCNTLMALALPYADHPGWREEWRQ